MNKLSKTITTERLLKNVLWQFKRRSNGDPIWSVVADICRVGSTHAIEICEEIGVKPFANTYTEAAQPRVERTGEAGSANACPFCDASAEDIADYKRLVPIEPPNSLP